ncbi:hypothetical protein A3850_003295 [Lewinella sp. 4G2]|nr:hypothetical protein A3850_003295 [Lewinella sp. 4G2]
MGSLAFPAEIAIGWGCFLVWLRGLGPIKLQQYLVFDRVNKKIKKKKKVLPRVSHPLFLFIALSFL